MARDELQKVGKPLFDEGILFALVRGDACYDLTEYLVSGFQ